MQFSAALVSRSTILLMHTKLEKLIAEFNELAQQELGLTDQDMLRMRALDRIKNIHN